MPGYDCADKNKPEEYVSIFLRLIKLPIVSIKLIIRYLNLGNILHGEADSAHFVLTKAYNGNLFSKSKNILYTVDSFLCDLGNMNHSFFSGSEFDECAEFLNTYNGSLENLAFLEISR